MKLTALTLAAGALIALHAPTLSFAQTTNPGLRLQYSEITGVDNKVYIYGIPTTDSAGNRKTYDAVIDLSAASNGSVASTASVTSTPTVAFPPSKLVAGTYKSSGAATCKVSNSILKTGRAQSFFQCLSDSGASLELAVVTGSVGAGHPFTTELVRAGIDKRADVANFAWGLSTKGGSNIGGCGGFNTGYPIAAQQVGNQIVLSYFRYYDGAIYCSTTLTKTP
jgi:hypothetical protein